MKKRYLINLFLMLTLLNGCGGNSESKAEEKKSEVSLAKSQITFYLPSWFSPVGEIIIRSQSGETITSANTLSLNNENITIESNQIITIEYTPITKSILCPVTIGCGDSYSGEHQDINANGKIDYNEAFTVDIIFAAKVFLSPGANKVYFSLLSQIESSTEVNSHLKSLSITPNYHQTYTDKENTRRYKFLADGSYYALFKSIKSPQSIRLIKESLILFVQNNEISDMATDYFTNLDDYLSEQQKSNDDALINDDLVKEKFSLNRLLANSSKHFTPSHSPNVNDKILLEQFRNVLAFINIQELKYNDEVSDKITELSSFLTDDSTHTLAILSEILTEILQLYSPTNDTAAGFYQYQGLDINYRGSPYTWIISGIYKETEINLELRIPQWRISAARGDLFEASILGNVTSKYTSLTLNTDNLLLRFDGVTDVFNDEKAKTATLNLITSLSILTENGEITGRINMTGERVKNESELLASILNQFSFSGLLKTKNQTTNISIIAIKNSQSLAQNENDFIYDVLLDLPSSGSADFRLSISGLSTNFERLDNVNLALRMQGKVLALTLAQNNDTRKLVIKGLDGRWLTLLQQKKDYTGQLYFGNKIIGEVITIRGLPGILFPNGDFHSIF
ncbi:MAG: hypothetical protein ACI9N3_000819 [Colwellia sp.]